MDALAKLALSSEFVRAIEAEKPSSSRTAEFVEVCRSSLCAVQKWPVPGLVIGTRSRLQIVPTVSGCLHNPNLQTTNSSVLL